MKILYHTEHGAMIPLVLEATPYHTVDAIPIPHKVLNLSCTPEKKGVV